MKHVMYILVGFALITGCSKKAPGGGASDDGKVASCALPDSCREYRGGNLALGTEGIEKLCTTVMSTAKFSLTPCPTTKLIATCQGKEGKDFFYEGYPIELATLEKTCKEMGATFAKP